MSAKHTPGPWMFDGESRVDAVHFRTLSKLSDGSDYINGVVALPYSCGDGSHDVKENHKANARLIAASPEMLSVLEEILEYFTDREDADHDGSKFVGNVEMRHAQAIREVIAKATGAQP